MVFSSWVSLCSVRVRRRSVMPCEGQDWVCTLPALVVVDVDHFELFVAADLGSLRIKVS